MNATRRSGFRRAAFIATSLFEEIDDRLALPHRIPVSDRRSALFAPVIAPYEPTCQCLDKSFHPPTGLFFKDGALYAKVYENVDPSVAKYKPVEGKGIKVRFFAPVEGNDYKIFGLIPFNVKLFSADSDQPDARIFLLGSDSTGRDIFSRLLYGARISLSIGFIGIAITMVIGFIVGGLAGYFGGTFDFISMRFVEFLMAVPGLYLLLAMRSALAPHFDSAQMYLMIVIILSFFGWASTARVIRGMSLSLAKRQFVQAAEKKNSDAMRQIGRMHYRGDGITQDYAAAMTWFKAAAAEGNAGAMYDVGNMYYNGNGVSPDYAEALAWFRKAADKGDIVAMQFLSIMYKEGIGVPKNNVESVRWRKAAEKARSN